MHIRLPYKIHYLFHKLYSNSPKILYIVKFSLHFHGFSLKI